MMNKNKIIAFLIAVVILLFFHSYHLSKRPEIYTYHTDVKIIKDTFTQYFPKPIEIIKLKDTTIYVNDTTYIFLPIEKKRFQTENYDLTISGYNPTLESITVFPETRYIYQTTTAINEKKKVTFNHGVQGGFGYGLINKKVDVWLGYGFQLSF